MKKTLKKWWFLGTNIFLNILFANRVSAQVSDLPPMQPMYGVHTPIDTIVDSLPWVVGASIVFIIGTIWYYKKGGIKKWPKVVAWILLILSILIIIGLKFLGIIMWY